MSACADRGSSAAASGGLLLFVFRTVPFSRLLLFVLGALLFSPSVVAAPLRLQGFGEASLGVTDNATSAPEVPLPGGAERTPGAFVRLRPGLVLSLLSSRTVQRLTYSYDYNLFFAANATNSSSNRLEYRGFYDISPRLNAVVGAAATESNSYATLTFAPPGSGTLPLLPGATGRLLQLSADELVNVELAVGWRAYQGASVSYATPIFDTEGPVTVAPNALLGVEYSWIGNALGAEGRAQYTVVRDGIRADGTRVELQQQLVVGGVGRYRRDIGRYFTSSVEAGVLRVQRLNTDEGAWYPTAGAMLGYADVLGAAQLTYAHTVTTNALLGQSLLIDEVRLRGAVPLDQREEFVVAASAGYQVGRLLDDQAELAANVSVFLADATFGWQATRLLLLGLRYQHINQSSDVRVPALPVSYYSHTVMLGATFRYPPDLDMPRAYRAPSRVDRSDELRGIGDPADPRVPAPGSRVR